MPVLRINKEYTFLTPIDVPMIRLGKKYDGGYLISKNVLEHSDNLVSMGMDTDWSFASDWKEIKPHSKIYAYDGTVNVSEWNEDQQEAYHSFFPANAEHIQENVTVKNISRILDAVEDKTFFTIDIEGSEYNILKHVANSEKVTGFVVEFHALDISSCRKDFDSLVKEIQKRYTIVHVHGNNHGGVCSDNVPHTLEITFVKNDLCETNKKRYKAHIPDLDMPNAINEEEYFLYFTEIFDK